MGQQVGHYCVMMLLLGYGVCSRTMIDVSSTTLMHGITLLLVALYRIDITKQSRQWVPVYPCICRQGST